MKHFAALLLLSAPWAATAQNLYFPPSTPGAWETVDPASLGWCVDSIPPLLEFIEESNSKAFIVLKDGRIAIEHYVGTFTQDSVWYWASAGKSLTAFLVGAAQADGLLDINDPSSDYLGTGWTGCTPAQEAAITVRHQLTMTTGLDDGVADPDCTDPACLQFLADPDTRWAYHNAAYTKLDGVITAATGQTLNNFVYTTLTPTTGIAGVYLPIGYNNVFFSTPRSMARFGLLSLNRGVWNGTDVLGDDDYFEAMTTPSQALNESYGYLWWLNGQPTVMVPGLQFVFAGPLLPNEPTDAVNALGKNGQQINVVPSQGLVVVRMGNSPGTGAAVAIQFADDLWARLNNVLCSSTAIAPQDLPSTGVHPSPASDRLSITSSSALEPYAEILGMDGRMAIVPIEQGNIDVNALANGSYVVRYRDVNGRSFSSRFQILR